MSEPKTIRIYEIKAMHEIVCMGYTDDDEAKTSAIKDLEYLKEIGMIESSRIPTDKKYIAEVI